MKNTFRHRKSISLGNTKLNIKILMTQPVWQRPRSLWPFQNTAVVVLEVQNRGFLGQASWISPNLAKNATILPVSCSFCSWEAIEAAGWLEVQLVCWFVGLWKSRKGRFLCRFLCTGCPCIWRCIRQSYHSLSFKDDYLKWNLGRTIGVTWPIISFFSHVVYHLRDDLVCYCPLFFLMWAPDIWPGQFPA